MKKSVNGIIGIVLAIAVLIAGIPLNVPAAESDVSYVTNGIYSYTSNEGSNKQLEDNFTFRKDCFMRSSYLGCCHLAELSAQAAIASASRYGDKEDKDEVDPSNNGQNIKKMLKDMGFEDVQTNAYYDFEKLENSAAVAIGHRTIEAFGKKYTLLAIIPRSAGYKQEWVGNFTVGDGMVHEGFKAGRDEILRFTKQYISEQNIRGALKVWITGHSRGSALANLVGGFFAGGGIEYFGDKVSITPEDVYCYTFANPTVIKDGAGKNETLSVAGARGGIYSNDSPGRAYNYTKGGTVNVRDGIFNGIRNYPLPYDLITMLPPESWGFTLYGRILSSDGDGLVSVEDMLAELKEISPFACGQFTEGGDFRSFEWTTVDIKNLSLAKDTSVTEGGAAEFFRQRIEGISHNVPTSRLYASGKYQTTFKAISGIFGMLFALFYEDFDLEISELIKPLAVTYLAYASERLKEENQLF